MSDWIANHRRKRDEHSTVGADKADGTPDQNPLDAKVKDSKIEEKDR